MNAGDQQIGTEAPLSAKDLEIGESVSVVLTDTEEVWHTLFAEMGYQYREP